MVRYVQTSFLRVSAYSNVSCSRYTGILNLLIISAFNLWFFGVELVVLEIGQSTIGIFILVVTLLVDVANFTLLYCVVKSIVTVCRAFW